MYGTAELPLKSLLRPTNELTLMQFGRLTLRLLYSCGFASTHRLRHPSCRSKNRELLMCSPSLAPISTTVRAFPNRPRGAAHEQRPPGKSHVAHLVPS